MLKLPLDSLSQQAEFATTSIAAMKSLSVDPHLALVLALVFFRMLPEISREIRAWVRELRRK